MPASARHPLSAGLIAAAVIGGGLAAWYTFRSEPPPPDPPPEEAATDPAPPDPRLTFPTTFRNVEPEVRYVGDAVCAGCHPSIDKTYHAHPMGRSAGLVSRVPPVERFDEAARPSFSVGDFQLRVEKAPGGLVHHVAAPGAPEYITPAEVAIGSGTRGRSYLSVEGGAVWQSPISWFATEGRWDLSPGFRLGGGARRPVIPECLFCHVDRVEPVPGALNRYREPLFPGQVAIGCERCHGPGGLHVAERTDGPAAAGVDTSIVNPKHLPPDLRAAVCEQCHLQGEERVARRGRSVYEFRPGLPFERFVSVFVRHPELAEAHKSVGQFEQMERSVCFTASNGKLGCTTCHDPHESPTAANRDRFYRGRCLTCHESKGCSLPLPDRRAKADSCIACHMPRAGSATIAHASVTDHRIPRVPAPPPPGVPSLPFGTVPLVRFRTGPHSPPEAERERDLGIALARFAGKVPAGEVATRQTLHGYAADRLRESLATWKGDAIGWDALRSVLPARSEEKLAAATAAVRLAPESEAALTGLVEAATAAGQFDVADEAAVKLIRMNPTAVEPRVGRAFLNLRRGKWPEAEADCRAALRLLPLHPEARLYLAIALHQQGDAAGGRREAETAARMEADPRQRAGLLEWFKSATR
jgi:hypothetical protein